MDAPRQLLLLCMCVCTHTSPLQDLHHRRSRSGAGVYASDFAADYEPFMYAAIPLHGPMPVLQVLSRRPLSGDRNHSPSYQHPVYARPPRHENQYASLDNEDEYAGYRHNEAQSYLDPNHPSSYAQQYAAPSSHDEVSILYARPNPHGGFSYRRGPTKTGPKKSQTPSTESPVIIRVHRYRVVRDP